MVQCPHEDCSDSNKEFQSDVTMRQHHTKVHDVQLPNCECAKCEEEFFKENGNRKYCDSCKYEGQYKGENNPNYSGGKEKTECEECEKEFSYYPSEKSNNICKECGNNTIESVMCTHCGEVTSETIYDESSNLPYCSDKCLRDTFAFESQVDNSKDIGDISESRVISYLKKNGYNVSIPFGDNARYDLVLDIKDMLLRVQVKTGRETKKGVMRFNANSVIRKSGETQCREPYENDADVFAIFYPNLDAIYWIPIEDAPETTMYLRYQEPEQRQPDINYVEQYTFERGIGRTLRYMDEN